MVNQDKSPNSVEVPMTKHYEEKEETLLHWSILSFVRNLKMISLYSMSYMIHV